MQSALETFIKQLLMFARFKETAKRGWKERESKENQSHSSQSFSQFLTVSRNYFAFVFVFYALTALKFAIYLIYLYYIFYFVFLINYFTLLFRDLDARSSVCAFRRRTRTWKTSFMQQFVASFICCYCRLGFVYMYILYNLCEQFNCYFVQNTLTLCCLMLSTLYRDRTLSRSKRKNTIKNG